MHSKGNHKQDEKQLSERERTFAKEETEKRLISNMYIYTAHGAQYKKHKQYSQKMDRRPK